MKTTITWSNTKDTNELVIQQYRDSVYNTVELALNADGGMTEAMNMARTSLHHRVSTFREFLEYHEVTAEQYERDCMNVYIWELERIRQQQQFQMDKLREELGY